MFDGGRLSDSEEARLGSTVVDLSQVGFREICLHGINSEAKNSFFRREATESSGEAVCRRELRLS